MKSLLRSRPARWSLTTGLLVVASLWLSAWSGEIRQRSRSPLPLGPTLRWTPALERLGVPGETQLPTDAVELPIAFTLDRGQTLAGALAEAGVGATEAHRAMVAVAEHVDLRRLRPGERGDLWLDGDLGLVALHLDLPGRGRVRASRDGDEYRSEWIEAVRHVETRALAGSLDTGSVEAAVVAAGGDPRLAYALADVFQWDLDFNRDLRLGDRFRVVYEEVRLDGEPAGPGAIRAAVYENRGQRYEAFRFEDGYYDAEGRPAEKMFLRSPMPFTRVTSRFSSSRFHPVLKKHRPHYGVDYGAPTGTPVQVTAAGTVEFAGRSGGAGNMVKVRHPNGYLTAYLHLSRYGPGVRRGARLRQGQVVGYVGSTGLSTGPHLDYRIQKDGRWIDPLAMKNVPAPPIPDALQDEFRRVRDEMVEALATAGSPTPTEPAPPATLAST